MKRMVFSALMIMIISTSLLARKLVAEGNTYSAFGNFRIETADQPLIINGVALDTYIVSYENSNMSVTIAIDKDKKCKRYITISDFLSVQYVCYGTHFGVEKLDKKYVEAGLKTSDAGLDRAEYFHQKVLTQGQKDAIYCMKLIGVYFPHLLNEAEAITASR